MIHPAGSVQPSNPPHRQRSRVAVCIVWLGSLAAAAPTNGQFGGMNPFQTVGHPQGMAAESPPSLQVNMAAFTREYHPLQLVDASGDVDERAAAIERALDQVLDEAWDFEESPLRDVVDVVRLTLALPLVLDIRACEAGGIDPDTPITFQARDMTARTALRGLLDTVDMTWTTGDGRISVTTREGATASPVIRVYPLPWGFAERRPAEAHVLATTLLETVAVATWETVGGPGAIRVVESGGEPLLVVSQTCAAHDAILALLRTLHARACAEFGDPADPWADRRPVIRIHRVVDDAARADLVARLKDLCNGSLRDAVDPDASVTAIGGTIAVRSRSPQFQALAGLVIAAVAGREAPVPAASSDEPAPDESAAEPAAAEPEPAAAE